MKKEEIEKEIKYLEAFKMALSNISLEEEYKDKRELSDEDIKKLYIKVMKGNKHGKIWRLFYQRYGSFKK